MQLPKEDCGDILSEHANDAVQEKHMAYSLQSGKHNTVRVSAMCLKDKHSRCYTVSCPCPCHGPNDLVPKGDAGDKAKARRHCGA